MSTTHHVSVSLVSILNEDILPQVLSHLTLVEVLRMRLCRHLRDAVFRSTHQLWADNDYCGVEPAREYHHITSARKARMILQNFPNLRSLRMSGLRLTYQSLVQGRNGTSVSPRYLCSLLHEAECAQKLECLELLEVSEADNEGQIATENDFGERGAAMPPTYSLHTDIRLQGLRKLAVTMNRATNIRESPLVHSLLRSSHMITHLNLSGCACFDDYHLQEGILKPLANTLTHLTLSDSRINRPSIQSMTLKSLVLQGCINLRSISPDSCCPSLEVLELSSCPSFHGRGLLDNELGLSIFCPRLQMLNLTNCISFRIVTIRPVTFSSAASGLLPFLQSIDLAMCIHLNVVTIEGLSALKTINFGQCFHLRDLSIASPVMETLDLSNLSLEHISICCTSLVHLNLAGSLNLGDKRRVNRSTVESERLQTVEIQGARYLTPEFISDATGNRNSKMLILQ